MLPLPLERARSLFNEGRFTAALAVFGDGIPQDPSLALSCAEATNELGNADRALYIAALVEKRNSENAGIVAAARRITASVHIDRGNRLTAVDHLRSAISLAEAVGEHAEAARAALRLFTCVHSASGRAESAEVLAVAKRLVLRSNQPRLLADLHSRVGQAEAQSGNLRAARHHLDRAADILAAHPHHAMQARTKLALSSTLALLAHNDAATHEAKEALRAAETAGSVSLVRLCRANVAQLQFRTGALRHACRTAKELLDSAELPSPFRLAVLETYVAALLETRQCGEGVAEVDEFLAVMTKQEDPSWVAVEAVPTQARVLELLRGPAQARSALAKGRASSGRRHHADSVCRLWLIEAEMTLRSGLKAEGEQLMGEVTSRVGDHPSMELLGLLERARALVAVCSGLTSVAQVHFGRSERLLRRCGLRTEARRTRELRRSATRQPRLPDPHLRRSHQALAAASDAPFLGALTAHPRILAAEFQHAVRRLGLVTDAWVQVGGDPSPSKNTGELLRVFCGREPDGEVHVAMNPVQSYVEQQRLNGLAISVAHAVNAYEARESRASLNDFFDVDIASGSNRGLYISAPMQRLLHQVRQVARTELPVLVRGETGTGKEIVAEEVHALSRRAQQPFVPFNVTAVPRDMLEGQLFGYRRGAFTGAVNDAKGLIREAEGGTLFIDEIGELSPDLQPKLLRFLESGEIQPLGERPQRVDVRIVAATNARLDQLVKDGRFRDDLFYRLNVVSLTIPPLRDRREEIPTLINHFLTQHAKAAGKLIPQLTPQALERLAAYEWPGNVRQLTNELKRIVALHDENELVDLEHLAEVIRQPPAPASDVRHAAPDDTTVNVHLDQPLQGMYDDVERAAIPRALRLSHNNQTETAQRLGITRKGLYLKRRRLGLPADHA